MEDPVVDTNTGYTYERRAIDDYTRRSGCTCPITRQRMGRLIRNRAVRDAVEQWCADNNVTVSATAPAPRATTPAPTRQSFVPHFLQGDDVAVAENMARNWLAAINNIAATTFSNIYVPFIHAVF
eukprot:SAG11_NODE_16910_length_533_cov_30.426267_1_plen_124_part_10